MAITSAALQAALGVATGRDPLVVRELPPYGAASQYWVVVGGPTRPGRTRSVVTTAADNAAAQAVTVLAALAA